MEEVDDIFNEKLMRESDDDFDIPEEFLDEAGYFKGRKLYIAS